MTPCGRLPLLPPREQYKADRLGLGQLVKGQPGHAYYPTFPTEHNGSDLQDS